MKVLELYSGIGGMHLALNESGVPGTVKAAIEINNVANDIYKHNFPETNLLNLNIGGLSAEKINKLDVDTILMSPPCQPFTRNGNQKDINDARTDSFQHILNLLPELNIKRILIENVKGFDRSEMRNILLETLKNNNFIYQEFILSPVQFGVPNSRGRYYCMAKKLPDKFNFETVPRPLESLPSCDGAVKECFEIQTIIEKDLDCTRYYLPDKTLRKRINLLDIVFPGSKRSCCFTKAYGRFIEGAGSVFTNCSENYVASTFDKLKKFINVEKEEYLDLARSLNLRFFTPREIARLMCFPDTFTFPNHTSHRQKYMVLGNSINVKVVSKLIKLLND